MQLLLEGTSFLIIFQAGIEEWNSYLLKRKYVGFMNWTTQNRIKLTLSSLLLLFLNEINIMNLLVWGYLWSKSKGTQSWKKDFMAHISIHKRYVRCDKLTNWNMGVLAKSFIDKGSGADDVTNGIVKERLAQDDIRKKGVPFGQFSSRLNWAHALDQILVDFIVLELEGWSILKWIPSLPPRALKWSYHPSWAGETFHLKYLTTG